MVTIILFEDEGWRNFLPLTSWRSVFELQIGCETLLNRMARQLGLPISGVWTRDWMAKVATRRCGAPANGAIHGGDILVNGRWLPEGPMPFPQRPCVGLVDGQVAYVVTDDRLASQLAPSTMLDPGLRRAVLKGVEEIPAPGTMIRYPWEFIRGLRDRLMHDFPANQTNARVHPTAVIDTSSGPVCLGEDVIVGPYAVIEGPAYIGPGTHIHPHAWLHGGNAIGPDCRIGGELHGCVIHGHTNKQHAGFLGHAYVGSWVNIGAGTNNSDLKNTYGTVRVPLNGTDMDTGETFFGAILGDHAKIGINAAIPAGAVIGFAAMIARSGTLPRSVPSFAWLTEDSEGAGDPARLLEVARRVMSRRSVELSDDEQELFLDIATRTLGNGARD